MRDSVNQLVRFFERHLATVLAVLLFACLAMVHYLWRPNLLPADLAGNLFAESFGILFTVGLLDQLIQANERRRSRGARFAAYQTANRVLMRFFGLWKGIVRATFPPDEHARIDTLSGATIRQVQQRFPLEQNADVLPPMPWFSYVPHALTELTRMIDTCIQRYQRDIDPQLLDLFRRVEELPVIQAHMNLRAVREGLEHMGRPLRNGLLISEASFPQDIAVLTELSNLLKKQSREFVNIPGYIPPYQITNRV